MQERMQFLCGAGSLVLWLLSYLFIVGYATPAADLSMAWTSRPTGFSGFSQWSGIFESPRSTWFNATRLAMRVTGCSLPSDPSPLCQCLSNVSQVAGSQCPAAGDNAIAQCFLSARPPASISASSHATRPYMWLLAVNTWAAMVGTVLLVKSKLMDKGSYAVQLMVQIMIIAITVGTQWLMFSAPPGEWAVVLGVAVAMVVLGWSGAAGDDDPDWWVLHLTLLYTAVLPALCVMYNAYNQRRDVLYMVTTVMMTLVVAIVTAVRSLLDRAKCQDSDDAIMFCDLVLKLLTLSLVGLSYDTDTVNMLESATPVFWIYTLYLGLSFADDAGFVYVIELALRATLTLLMLDELWG